MAGDDLASAVTGLSEGIRDIAIPFFQGKIAKRQRQELLADERMRTAIPGSRVKSLSTGNISDNDLLFPEEAALFNQGVAKKKKEADEAMDLQKQIAKEAREEQSLIAKEKRQQGFKIDEEKRSFESAKNLATFNAGLKANGAAKKPATQAQHIVANYASRLVQAGKVFDEIEKDVTGMGALNLGVQQKLPTWANSDTVRRQKQAQSNFLNATLRRESGAVISPSEFEEGRNQYFPQPGDDAKTLKQKKENRQLVSRNFIRAAGDAYEDVDSILGMGGSGGAAAIDELADDDELQELFQGYQYPGGGR